MAETTAAPAPPAAPGRRFKTVRLVLSLPEKALYALRIRSTKSLCLPHFLIIGAPKAGTTWLAKNLDSHPDVFMAKRPGCLDPTEVRYFSQSLCLPLTYYSNLFLAGRDKIRGDKSPAYCTMSSPRIRFIRSILPEIRIVFFVRDPVERAWSHAVMNLVKLKQRKIEDVPPSLFYKHFVRDGDRLRYSRVLERWRRIFPEDQIYTGFYEDIGRDPIGVLRRVCEHIGADTGVDWTRFPYNRVVNRGPQPSMPDEYRSFLEGMYREEIVQLEERFGSPVSRWRSAASAAGRLVATALGLVFSLAQSALEVAAWV